MRTKVVVAGLVIVPLVIAALVYGGSLMKDRPTSDARQANTEPSVPPAAGEQKGGGETPDPDREVVFSAPGFT